jgi:very-short-patch-repair endonuclease
MGYKNDLTGQQFGNWKVLEYAGDRHWICECQCENKTIKSIHAYSLTSGRSTSCGCKSSINSDKYKEGDIIGNWKILSTKASKPTHWLCECQCENKTVKEINKYTIINGKSTSCGCGRIEMYLDDLTNKTFGTWKALEYVGDKQWNCECTTCKTKKIIPGQKLREGRYPNCRHPLLTMVNDISDRKFGKLTPIKYLGKKSWLCHCDCGNNKVILSANLLNNSTISCGCESGPIFNREEVINEINKLALENNTSTVGIYSLAEKLGVSLNTVKRYIETYELEDYISKRYGSSLEYKIAKILDNNNIQYKMHNRDILGELELDFYIPSKRLAIEVNGDYWHSSFYKESLYHQKKTLECAKKNIRLIHIFENEMINHADAIMSIINDSLEINTKQLSANNCNIAEISNEDKKEFENKYHLNGYCSADVNIALYIENELVQVIGFSIPKFDSKYTYEIIRNTHKNNVDIVDGTKRIFEYFISKYKASSVGVKVDASKYTGMQYIKIGFKPCSDYISQPDYKWIKRDKVLTRYQTQKQNLIQHGLGNDSDTEDDIMYNLGFYKVYDSGNLKLEWFNNKI